ncbi:MAG: GIY-YIG nuclease family protein [Ruthenibacterium lactatiformans]
MPSEARKRELKEQYKAMRPEMGVFVFRCVPTGKNYVGWTHDLKGTLNSLRFQLSRAAAGKGAAGGVACSWWSGVCVDVLEKLPYDKDDETKTDYSEELTLLCRLWQEKLPDHEEVWRNRT